METKEIKKEVLDLAIAASVFKAIGSCKNFTPEEAQAAVKKAVDTVERAFATFALGQDKDDAQSQKKESAADAQPQESIGESLVTRINDLTRAFEAYNLFTVILSKYEGREVTVKHLTKMAKRFMRICLKGVDGVELDNIRTEVKTDKDGRGHLTLSFLKTVKEEK